MVRMVRTITFVFNIFALAVLMLDAAQAQTPAAKTQDASSGKQPAAAQPVAAESLAVQEQQLTDRYKRLEEVLLRMAELTGSSDPRRAAMLKKAVAQSKERLVSVQFEQIVGLLEKEQLSRAIENQGELDKDLKALLELLMSENRAKRLESEKARIARYLKLLGDLIKDQKSIQGRTPSETDPQRLAAEQGRLADKTGGLAKDVKSSSEEASSPETHPNDSAPPQADKAPDQDKHQPKTKPAQPKGRSKSQNKGDGQGKNEPKGQGTPEQKPSPADKGSKPGNGQTPDRPNEGGDQPSENGENDEPQLADQQTPPHKRIEAAEKRMREARQKLDEAHRTDAAKAQEEALRELQQAKAALEEILRQLREEEMDRVLAMLEVRFRKMLQMQREVLEGTVRLDKIAEKDRTHEHDIEAGTLSGKEAQIVSEADRALLLLRDDGTAVAFPEALTQARQDMQQIVERLADSKVNKITQNLEEDVIAALDEMIEALKKAQKKLEDQKQRPSAPNSGMGQDEPLVDTLSELKMIRTLQMRVNTRTDRYAKLIEGEQAEKAELIEALRRLAEREAKIFEITRDLDMGKNQ